MRERSRDKIPSVIHLLFRQWFIDDARPACIPSHRQSKVPSIPFTQKLIVYTCCYKRFRKTGSEEFLLFIQFPQICIPSRLSISRSTIPLCSHVGRDQYFLNCKWSASVLWKVFSDADAATDGWMIVSISGYIMHTSVMIMLYITYFVMIWIWTNSGCVFLDHDSGKVFHKEK